MNLPRVSVILPTYNGEKFLTQQIESILNQTDVEVLLYVRDDASFDTTTEILEGYRNKLALVDFGNKNIGTIESLQILLTKVKSDGFIAFADQDDVWKHNHLSNAIKFLNATSSNHPSLYFPLYDYIDFNGKQRSK